MQTTYRDIVTFLNAANAWLADPKHQAESKFRYGLRKVTKTGEKAWASYLEQVEDLDIEHCATGKDGVILKDERGAVAFTKDGLRARNAARKKLFESDVEIAAFMAKEPPKDLTDAERDAFAGFVLPVPGEDAEAA